jgi:hypothetical protein
MKHYILFIFGLISFIQPVGVNAQGLSDVVCNESFSPNNANNKGLLCGFDTLPGELITVQYVYRQNYPSPNYINYDDYVDIIYGSDYKRKRSYLSQIENNGGVLKYIATNSREEISYELSGINTGENFEIVVANQRGNVLMIETNMNKDTGDIHLKYGVAPDVDFYPNGYVCINLDYGRDNTYTGAVGAGRPINTDDPSYICLDDCVGKRDSKESV